MANSKLDDNSNPTLIAGSNADSGETPIRLLADSTTNRLLVNSTISGSLTTSAGTATLTDDSAFQVGTAAVTPAGGVYKSTRDTIDDGDVGAVAINANRAQLVVLETPNGDSVIDDTNDAVKVNLVAGSSSGVQFNNGQALGGGTATLAGGSDGTNVRPIKIDSSGRQILGQGTATIGTAFIQFASGVSLPAGTNNIGDVDVLTLPALAAGSNVIGTATINDGGGSITVDGSVTVSSLPALAAGSNTIGTATINDGGGSITVDGSVSVSSLPALATGGNTIGTATLGASNAVIGTASIRFAGGVSLPAGTNNIGDVDVLTLPALTAGSNVIGTATVNDGGGSLTVDGTVSLGAGATTIGTATVNGNIAHDVVDGGNPVKTGAHATATLSTVTLAAAGDRVNNMADLDGALIIRTHAPLGDNVIGTAQITTNTSTQVMAAGAAGIKNHITDVIIANAGGTAVVVEILDGTATRTWFPAPSGSAGVVHAFTFPLKGSAATAWNAKASGTTTLFVTFNGFKSKI